MGVGFLGLGREVDRLLVGRGRRRNVGEEYR